MVNRDEIGWRVLRWRRQAGLTQQQLADLAGIARNTVARIELGQNMAETTTLANIATALNKSLSDLLAPVELAS
jgi:transcriptional regulator with XRE-family HTH domain